MRYTKVFSLLLIVGICLSVVSTMVACGDTHHASDNTTFKIGLSAPLSGDKALYGVAVQCGAQLAISEINKAGGLNGVMFELMVSDDMDNVDQVAFNYSTMYENGMQVSLGAVTTASCMEFSYLSKNDNLFFLTPSASGDRIPAFDNGYQMCFSAGVQSKQAASFVNERFQGQTVGMLYQEDEEYSNEIAKQFKTHLSGVTLIEASFTEANDTDFTDQIHMLKNCSFIFMPLYYAPAARFMQQAKDVMPADAVYYGCDGLDGIDCVEAFDIKGISQAVTTLTHFDPRDEGERVAAFISGYKAKYPDKPMNQFAASAYDCVYAIYGAMQAAIDDGKEISVDISASDLCDILKEQFRGGYTLAEGVTGRNIQWTNTGYVNKEIELYVIKYATSLE